MPYHTKKKDKPKMIIVIKKNKKRELKPEEKDLFKIHAKIHSKAHVDFMKNYIKAGKGCYSDSHKAAMKKVGK